MCKINNNSPTNYISYEPTVLFGDKGYLVKEFYPYYEIVVVLSEINKCPFCGQVIKSDLKCNCDEYKRAFKKLLKNYGIPSKSTFDLRMYMQESPTFYRLVDEISLRSLEEQEINAFDANFWDFSIMHPVCGDKGFRLANPSYENGVLKFYWKDLKTKKVFLCSLELEVDVKKSFFLVAGENRKLIAECKDWNELCELLKKL